MGAMDGRHVSLRCGDAIAHSCQMNCQDYAKPVHFAGLVHLPRVVGPYAQTAVDTAAGIRRQPQQLARQLGLPADRWHRRRSVAGRTLYPALLNAAAELSGDRISACTSANG